MIPWSENLRVLALRQPGVARILEALESGVDRGHWSTSRTGLPVVRLGPLGLCSSFDPHLEARRSLPDWGEETDFALLVGLGAGYLAEAVSQRYADLPLVIAESDPVWAAEVLRHRDLSALLARPQVVLLLGPDPQVVRKFFSNLSCGVVQTLTWRPLVELHPDWHRLLQQQVASAQSQARVNLLTYRRFGDLWRRNLHRNEHFARDLAPLAALKGLWAGVPAVIAAAGPSLDDQLEWMLAHRSRYVLIAVDTAWPVLASRGLIPDFLVILDGQYWNARHVDAPLPSSTLVVTEWTAPPRAFRLAPGRTFVAASSIPFLRSRELALWGALGDLPSGGSVATGAWSLALHLGCLEVAFAGLDLGYPQGQTHASGSQFEEAIHRRSSRFQPAETRGLSLRDSSTLEWRPSVDGGRVASDARMDLFRDWLSASVRAHPEVRAVNLSARGSVVEGLSPPGADFGGDWIPAKTHDPPRVPLLAKQSTPLEPPPFEALEAALTAEDFSTGLDAAWREAKSYWGDSVWDRWAGRAWSTWSSFPSPRSRRAVEEVLRLAISWRQFWKAPDFL